jgi:hypothetical protein
VVAGILIAYLSNYLVGLMNFGSAEWHWKPGVAAAPAVAFFLMLFGIPRSPRWLVSKGRVEKARQVLLLFNQLSGINAILSCLNSIFAAAGFSKVSGDLQLVAVGCSDCGNRQVSRRRSRDFQHGNPPESAGLATDRLHRVLRLLPGRSDLGLHERGVPDSPGDRRFIESRAVRGVRGDDDGTVF